MTNDDNRVECPSRRGRQYPLTYALHMSGNPVYGTKRWKELRTQVLQDEPVCHWCRKKPSTQADHCIEIDQGIEPGMSMAAGGESISRDMGEVIGKNGKATPLKKKV